MTKHKSAYDIVYKAITLTPEDRAAAVKWWQTSGVFHPLTCGVCGEDLEFNVEREVLSCPTTWCYYEQKHIPWVVFKAWKGRNE